MAHFQQHAYTLMPADQDRFLRTVGAFAKRTALKARLFAANAPQPVRFIPVEVAPKNTA